MKLTQTGSSSRMEVGFPFPLGAGRGRALGVVLDVGGGAGPLQSNPCVLLFGPTGAHK